VNGQLATAVPIRIGNQTSFAAADFLEPFHYALANQFDAFEWFPDKRPSGGGWDETDLSPARRSELKQAAHGAGMRLSVHARWMANPLHADCLPVLLRDLELAVSLGAPLLNVHLYTEAGLELYAKGLAPLLARAAAVGVQVSVENTPETTPQDFNEFFATLKRLAPAGFSQAGMCFDLGHANLCRATHNDYLAYLDQLGPHVPIVHLHVHENWGDTDTHLPLFTGPAAADARGIEGFLQRLRARQFSGSLILEQWPEPPSLLKAARDRLQQMLRSTEGILKT